MDHCTVVRALLVWVHFVIRYLLIAETVSRVFAQVVGNCSRMPAGEYEDGESTVKCPMQRRGIPAFFRWRRFWSTLLVSARLLPLSSLLVSFERSSKALAFIPSQSTSNRYFSGPSSNRPTHLRLRGGLQLRMPISSTPSTSPEGGTTVASALSMARYASHKTEAVRATPKRLGVLEGDYHPPSSKISASGFDLDDPRILG